MKVWDGTLDRACDRAEVLRKWIREIPWDAPYEYGDNAENELKAIEAFIQTGGKLSSYIQTGGRKLEDILPLNERQFVIADFIETGGKLEAYMRAGGKPEDFIREGGKFSAPDPVFFPDQIKALLESKKGMVRQEGQTVVALVGLGTILGELQTHNELVPLPAREIQRWIKKLDGTDYTLRSIEVENSAQRNPN